MDHRRAVKWVWRGAPLLLVPLLALVVARAQRPAPSRTVASSVAKATVPEQPAPAEVAVEPVASGPEPPEAAPAIRSSTSPSPTVQREPHPITSGHLDRFREADLVQAAGQALEKRDFARARELIATHRRDFPGARPDVDEGLEILADCMEHPSQATLERAAEFYRQRTASVLRRRLRQHCLER